MLDNKYGQITVAAAVILGGLTWLLFGAREEKPLAVFLVVVTALMPYAWWGSRGVTEPTIVTRGKYIVMVIVLLAVLLFAGMAFGWYEVTM